MPDPATIRLVLLAAVTCGYIALVWRMAAQGLIMRYPLFWSYCVLLAAKGAQWLAGSTVGFRWTESVILAVKVLVVLEAWAAVTCEMHEQPRRRGFLSLLIVALLCGAVMAWLPPEPNPIRAYVRHAIKLHVGLAVFCGGAVLALWQRWEWIPRPPRQAVAHGLILTAHVMGRCVALINYPAAATEQRQWELYYWQHFTYQAISLACLLLWWRTMRRE